jgi:hypothetical protein
MANPRINFIASTIRRHIIQLDPEKLFTTRELLKYGPRNAIDQTLWRLVKNGSIIRLARGVFVRASRTFTSPSPRAVAEAKAKGFGKEIVTHGAVLVNQLNLDAYPSDKNVFCVNGSSSSFRYGKITIYFRKASKRKIKLGDTRAGHAIRALWHLGKEMVDHYAIMKATREFMRTDRVEARQSAQWQPAWLSDYFVPAA